MAFEEFKKNIEDIQDQVNVYLKSHITHYKLLAFKIMMKSTTLILKFTLILLCFLMALFFGSIAAGFALSNLFGSYTLGFLAVGGVYLVVTILILFVKDKVVEGPILEKLSEIFFNN